MLSQQLRFAADLRRQVPSKPAGLRVHGSVQHDELCVTWDASVSNNGAEVTAYELEVHSEMGSVPPEI